MEIAIGWRRKEMHELRRYPVWECNSRRTRTDSEPDSPRLLHSGCVASVRATRTGRREPSSVHHAPYHTVCILGRGRCDLIDHRFPVRNAGCLSRQEMRRATWRPNSFCTEAAPAPQQSNRERFLGKNEVRSRRTR